MAAARVNGLRGEHLGCNRDARRSSTARSFPRGPRPEGPGPQNRSVHARSLIGIGSAEPASALRSAQLE